MNPKNWNPWLTLIAKIAAVIGILWGLVQFSIEYHDRDIESGIQMLLEDSNADRCQKAKRAAGATFELAVKQCQAENPRRP